MSFDLEVVRAQFPALALTDSGTRRIYFDNPAGTQVPSAVAEAMTDCLLSKNSNLGGYFTTAKDADVIVQSARNAMADFLNAPSSEEIIFGQNMTTITLHLSRSIGRLLKPGDEIILSRMDHDANVWPWVLLARDLQLEIRWLPFNRETFEFDLDVLDDIISERTRLICVGGASNLTGTIHNVKAICAKARAAGAMSFIDGVQSAPHIATDVVDIGCDFFVCSSYKFFGPHQGILWGRRELLEKLEPHKVRPVPAEIPGCFETGTQSHEGFACITATVNYFASIGASMGKAEAGTVSTLSERRGAICKAMKLLFDYEEQLARHLVDGLRSIDGVTVQGITAPAAMRRRVPTVSFTHSSATPAAVAKGLASENIFVWSGDNYAVEAAKALGVADTGGVVRVGPVHYNSIAEIDELLTILPGILAA